MDKKNLFWMIGLFLIGAIIGGVIMCLVCCNCNNGCTKSCKDSCKGSCKEIEVEKQSAALMLPVSGPLLISADSANAYFKCYMKTRHMITPPMTAPIRNNPIIQNKFFLSMG